MRPWVPNKQAIGRVIAASVGAGVVLAVHFARPWAENTPGDCQTFGDCADPMIGRYVALAFMVVAATLVVMALSFGVRALFMVPAAFATQGLLMFVVEHADGFWLSLPLDVVIGAASWAAIAYALGRRFHFRDT